VHVPPHPGKVSTLYTLARELKLVAIAGDAGRLDGAMISVEADVGCSVRWQVFDGAKLPPGLAPRLLHIEAYEGLIHGELDGDAILWKGRRYGLADAWQDGRLVAVLVEIGTPA